MPLKMFVRRRKLAKVDLAKDNLTVMATSRHLALEVQVVTGINSWEIRLKLSLEGKCEGRASIAQIVADVLRETGTRIPAKLCTLMKMMKL